MKIRDDRVHMYICICMAESLHCSPEGITVCINWLYPNTREGNGNSLQYFCLENSIDRRGWQDTVYAVAELDMTELMYVYPNTGSSKIKGLQGATSRGATLGMGQKKPVSSS